MELSNLGWEKEPRPICGQVYVLLRLVINFCRDFTLTERDDLKVVKVSIGTAF